MNPQTSFLQIQSIPTLILQHILSFAFLTGRFHVYNEVTVCIIGDLIVITAMYFDAYSKPRNVPNSHLHPPSSIPLQETTSKFTMLRPPPQNNPLAPKQPYTDLRSDNNKHNTSAHVFLSAAKPSTLPQRVNSNYPVRPEPTLSLPFSRHTLPQEQKYICHSPVKTGSRISAGMVFEEIPQNRYDYRRSESITEMKPLGEPFRDSSYNYYNPQQRLHSDSQDPRSAVPNTNTPLQLRFNPQQDRSRLSKKESVEGPLLTNRQERAEPPQVKQPYTQKKILKEGYSNLFQNKPTIPAFDPQKYEYLTARAETAEPLKKYDFQTRRFEPDPKRADAYKTFEEIYKNSLQSVLENSELRREGSQDFLRKYSVSKLPQDLDKSLDQDIETLRFASKKTDEVIDREMHKNAYLNQLFQQKGLRGASEDKVIENTKEKKEAASRNTVFERELEEKNRQLSEKVRLLADKQKDLQQKKKEIMLKSLEIAQKDKILVQRDRLLLEKEVLLGQKTKELIEKGKVVAEKDRIIAELGIEKERLIDGLSAEVCRLQDELAKRQNKWREGEIALQGQLFAISTNLTLNLAKNADLQAKLRQKEEQSLVKLQHVSTFQKTSEQQKGKIGRLESQLTNASQMIAQQQTTISTLQSTISSYEFRAKEQNVAFELLKQKSESEKSSLIQLYKKEMAELRAKMEATYQGQNKGNAQLQAEIAQLKQRNGLIEQELSCLSKKHKKTAQEQELLQEQYSEVVSLLLLPKQSPHEILLGRLRECLQGIARSDGMQAKELQRVQDYQLQRVQQEHLQRRHQELSRELKKVGTRLACASIQAQQGSRLLRQANNQILLMNLMNLNEKYRFLLENQ